jgi:hypothetical protein
VAQTAPKPSGGYVAPALVTFDVTATTQANCALKSVAPGKPMVHMLKGHHYQCVDRAVDPASGDLTDAPKPKGKDRKDKKVEDAKAKTKLKFERDAAAKLKAAAEAERRRKAVEKAAADKAKKDLAEKLKLLKAKKTAKPKDRSAGSESSAVRVR